MKHILLAISVLYFYTSFSQSHYCAATENLKDQILANPSLIGHLEDVERQIQEKINEGSRASILTIPVVFHVIHNGDAYGTGENITDEQVLSQLDALNRDYNNRNIDTNTIPAVFKPLLGNMQIEFCLARFDESGAIFSGIVRHNLGVVSWDRTQMESVGKPTTIWNASQYLNIWTARFSGDLNGVLGYAQFPGMGTTTDGIVLRYDCVGTTGPRNAGNELGRVATHEVGHWLGLYHIWGDDGGTADECAGTDFVGDTPNQRVEYYGRPIHPQVSCTEQNLFMNYMDYVDDSAKVMFSHGQVDRARATILTQRASLLTASSSCNLNLDVEFMKLIAPSDTECSNQMLSIIQFKNNGKININYLEVTYNIDGGTNKSAVWYGNLAPNKTSFFSLPKETISAGDHVLNIFLYNANHRGNDDYTINDNGSKSFYSSANGSLGFSVPILEGFESGVLSTDWSIENTNADRTWVINNSVGGYGTSSQCISIDNFDNSSNPTNRLDNLLTASYNLSGTNFPHIDFDVAYANRTTNRYDTLTLYSSTDCGHSWYPLWKQGALDLATSPETNTSFYPSSSQWKTVQVDITPFMYVDNIRFKFENKSGWGNILYLDNINIKSFGLAVPDEINHNEATKIFPNPASNMIEINGNSESIFPANYHILNYLGQEIQNGILYHNMDKINVNAIDNGTYLLQLDDALKNKSIHKISINH